VPRDNKRSGGCRNPREGQRHRLLGAWIPAERHQELSLNHALSQIQFEQASGHHPFLRQWFDQRICQSEVVAPALLPGMKERNQSPSDFVDGSQVTPLPSVAAYAGVCKIVWLRESAMFSADDVIELMRRIGVILMQQTILTAMSRALRHQMAKRLVDITGQKRDAGELALW